MDRSKYKEQSCSNAIDSCYKANLSEAAPCVTMYDVKKTQASYPKPKHMRNN